MPTPTIHDLRAMNAKIRTILEQVQPAQGRPNMVLPQEFCGMLESLMRAGDWLRTLPRPSGDLELVSEVAEYRANLERLRQVLPRIKTCLLAERARQESERSRLATAMAWAHAGKNTL